MNRPPLMVSSPLQTLLGACAEPNNDLLAAWSTGGNPNGAFVPPVRAYTRAVENGIEAQSRWLCETYRALCAGVVAPALVEIQIERAEHLTRATLDGWRSLTEMHLTDLPDGSDSAAAAPPAVIQPLIGTLSAWSGFARRVSGHELDWTEPPADTVAPVEVRQAS